MKQHTIIITWGVNSTPIELSGYVESVKLKTGEMIEVFFCREFICPIDGVVTDLGRSWIAFDVETGIQLPLRVSLKCTAVTRVKEMLGTITYKDFTESRENALEERKGK